MQRQLGLLLCCFTLRQAESQQITIGFYAEWGGHQTMGADGLVQGFDVDLSSLVCQKAGLTCAFMLSPWASFYTTDFQVLDATTDNIIPGLGLQNRWFDCGLGVTNTIARRGSTAWSAPYTDPNSYQAGFIGLSGTTLAADASDLGARKVGVVSATAQAGFAMSKYPGATFHEVSSSAALNSALANGEVDLIFHAMPEVTVEGAGYVGPGAETIGGGEAFVCHPALGDVVEKLNAGLQAAMADGSFRALCDANSGVSCIPSYMADYPRATYQVTTRADVVVGFYNQWHYHQRLGADGMTTGFDPELTKLVFEKAGMTVAIAFAPWPSMFVSSYPSLGMASNPIGAPGLGLQSKWFDCALGITNTIARRGSVAWSAPYTDPNSYQAGFIGLSGTTLAADASDLGNKIVGVTAATAQAGFAMSKYPGATFKEFPTNPALNDALANGDVHFVFDALSDITVEGAAHVGPPPEAVGGGEAFLCHPSLGDVVNHINAALQAAMNDGTYQALCNAHPEAACATEYHGDYPRASYQLQGGSSGGPTCGEVRDFYRNEACCGNAAKEVDLSNLCSAR